MHFAHICRTATAVAALGTLALLEAPVAHSQPDPSANPNAPASSTAPSSRAHRNAAMQKAVHQLVQRIDRYGGKVGVHVVDVTTGNVLAEHAAGTPFNPASNMKLLTAAAALWKLSPNHTYRTALYARRRGSTVGDLVLRSYGDPSLKAQDLWAMSQALGRWGIKRVDGDVLVDQSFFDDVIIPPGFDQQPNEWACFRAPVSAVPLNANAVTMHVAPRRSGSAALVSFAPDGFVDVVGRVRTSAPGSAQNVTLSLVPNGQRLEARVGGSIPEDSNRLRFPKRVDDPTLSAGYALYAILIEQGIEMKGKVRAGGEKARRRLTLHRSAPLGTLLHHLGKDSDNFYAEMIFKGLASGGKRRGLTADSGAEVVKAYLKEIGVEDEGIVIRNGSGLFDTNRLTARSLTTVLRAAYEDHTMRAEYVAHLAVSGVDGTLRWRFRDKSSRGRVRAKTGTLASVASLSGYVMRDGPHAPVAFSILVNGVNGKVRGTRVGIDKCVKAFVRELERQQPGG
ncbi:MAG: D-alanyl-D-alanine carboxypeptidase/D-alanyl-D-alanine-endopeptidase [Myxococcota bacterium]